MVKKSLAQKAWSARGAGRQRLPKRRTGRQFPFVWPDFRTEKPQWHEIDYQTFVREGFSLNQLVYEAIMYKARALWQVPLRAYRGDPKKPEPLDEQEPLSKLCLRPNIHQSWAELQGQNTIYLNLSGNVYMAMVRTDPDALPESIYSLRPDRVFIIPEKKNGKQSGIMGYLYVPEGKSAWRARTDRERQEALKSGAVSLFLPQDVMHIKLFNPNDPLEGMGYGMSPLCPSARPVDVDNAVTSFLKVFFERGAMMQGILSFKLPMEPDEMAQVRERWAEVYGGYENWDRIGVLDNEGSYQRISPTFDEMGFEAIDERNETRILGPFGVPPILIGTRVGLMRSTYSNYEQARKACWEDTLVPELSLFEVELKYCLSKDDTFVAYDTSKVPALRQDLSEQVDAWTKLVSHGVPKNQAADTVGLSLEALLDGDVIYMPNSLVPVDENGEETREPKVPMAFQAGEEDGQNDGLTGAEDDDRIPDEEDDDRIPDEIDCLRCGGRATLLSGMEAKGKNLFVDAPRGLYYCEKCGALLDKRSFTS